MAVRAKAVLVKPNQSTNLFTRATALAHMHHTTCTRSFSQITTRITPVTSQTLPASGGQTYQRYTNVYGLCPRVVDTISSSNVDACATGESAPIV